MIQARIKARAERDSDQVAPEFVRILKLEPDEGAGFCRALVKRQKALVTPYAFKILDEIFAKQVKAAMGDAPDAAPDSKTRNDEAEAGKDKVSPTPKDEKDKAMGDPASNEAKNQDKPNDDDMILADEPADGGTSDPPLVDKTADMIADMRKLSTASTPTTSDAVTQKSEVAATNVESKAPQGKKKSSLESSALAKAWLADDD